MRIHEPLDKILNQETKIKIIRFLFNTHAEWSGRQIAKEINISPATCHKALQNLYAEKILLLKSAGVTHLYRLNDSNYIVKNILAELFEKEKSIPKILNKILVKAINRKLKGKIVSVVLFGSVAKRKEKPLSDIDLMIVIKRPTDRRQIEHILDTVNDKTIELFNSRIEPYILTVADLKKKSKLAIIKEISKTGKLLSGKPLAELL